MTATALCNGIRGTRRTETGVHSVGVHRRTDILKPRTGVYGSHSSSWYYLRAVFSGSPGVIFAGIWTFDMTDLTFCYLHMTRHDIEVLDTIGSPDYLDGDLSADDVDVVPHMRPPNPEESEVLPSQVHPSYPYGNPLSIKHPASLPRRPYDPASRALFEDMGYGGGGVNGSLRWRDLALDLLFPVDQAREEAEKAAQARKMASGTTSNHPPAQQAPPPADPTIEDDEEENDENDDDEGDGEGEGEGESSYDDDEE